MPNPNPNPNPTLVAGGSFHNEGIMISWGEFTPAPNDGGGGDDDDDAKTQKS